MLKGKRKAGQSKPSRDHIKTAVGERVTFRAELMPGRDTQERTFKVARVLASGRVELIGLGGQHTMTEFERTQ